MSDYSAEVMSVKTFFQGDAAGKGKNLPLRIPELQRSFVWKREHVRGFWEDMQDHRLSETEIHEMFGGTVVLFTPPATDVNIQIPPLPELKIKSEEEITRLAIELRVANENTQFSRSSFTKKIDKKRAVSEVIDGQQRLTVLMIGAKILQEIGKVKGCQANIQAELETIYKKYNLPRLEHQGTDETTDFKNILNNHNGVNKLTTGWSSNDGTPIKVAYETTLEYFIEFIRGSKLKKRWKDFSRYMLEKTTIVCLETTKFHQSHLVFKSLNWKGRKLRTSELFKSILFHFSALHETKTNQGKIKQSWDNIVKSCTSARPERDDSVSEFLNDWCKSVGKRRSDKTNNPDHDEKELRLDETLKVLEYILRGECPRRGTNHGKVLSFVENLEAEAGRYAGIWMPTSALNSITTLWIDLIDLRRIFRQGGLVPILMYILRQKSGKPERDHGIRAILQCYIYAVIPEQSRVGLKNFTPADFAKETRKWIKDLQKIRVKKQRIPNLQAKARKLLAKDNLYPNVKSIRNKSDWNKKVNTRWKSIMTKSSVSPESAKLLLRYIESIDLVSPRPVALDYSSNYDKDRLQAEHIFPKSAKWGSEKKSDWRKEWDEDNKRWPVDEDERNDIKWKLGNYILLEKEVNNGAGVNSWKGHPRTHAPSKSPPRFKKGKKKGTQNFAGYGKIHFYKHYEWTDVDLTGPIGGSKLKGSQLKCVQNLVKSYSRPTCWTQSSITGRTSDLLSTALSATCPSIDLDYLW